MQAGLLAQERAQGKQDRRTLALRAAFEGASAALTLQE